MMDGYQRVIAIMVFKFCDRKVKSRARVTSVTEVLPQELYKPMNKKFKKKESPCEFFI